VLVLVQVQEWVLLLVLVQQKEWVLLVVEAGVQSRAGVQQQVVLPAPAQVEVEVPQLVLALGLQLGLLLLVLFPAATRGCVCHAQGCRLQQQQCTRHTPCERKQHQHQQNSQQQSEHLWIPRANIRKRVKQCLRCAYMHESAQESRHQWDTHTIGRYNALPETVRQTALCTDHKLLIDLPAAARSIKMIVEYKRASCPAISAPCAALTPCRRV
jgi:hypothetical protein